MILETTKKKSNGKKNNDRKGEASRVHNQWREILSSGYIYNTKYSKKENVVKIKELNKYIVENYSLEAITVKGNQIEICNSWNGLVLHLIGTAYNIYGNKLKSKLVVYDIMNIDISSVVYEDYNKNSNSVYTLFDTGLYIKISNKAERLIENIAKLEVMLGICADDLKFNIKEHNYSKKAAVEYDEQILMAYAFQQYINA